MSTNSFLHIESLLFRVSCSLLLCNPFLEKICVMHGLAIALLLHVVPPSDQDAMSGRHIPSSQTTQIQCLVQEAWLMGAA